MTPGRDVGKKKDENKLKRRTQLVVKSPHMGALKASTLAVILSKKEG